MWWATSFVRDSRGRRGIEVVGDVLGLALGASCGETGFCWLEKH